MGNFWRFGALLVAAALQFSPAAAQISPGGGVQQSGAVTPNNCTKWVSNGVIADAGACGGGSGTVTSVSVTTANGVSGSVATATTTPAISLTLGAITPTTVAIGAGSAITSSGAGGALGTNAFTSTTFAPLASPTFTGTVTAPTLVATTVNGNTITTGTGILTIAAGKTATFSNTLTFAGTDTSTLNIGAGGTLGSNAFTSTAFAPLTNASLVTPSIGVATGTSLALGGCTISSNALCVTGKSALGGNLTLSDGGGGDSFVYGFSGTPGGYAGNLMIDATGLKLGHNSAVRDIEFQINSVTQATIQQSGGLSIGTATDPAAGGLQLNGQEFIPNITTSSAAQTGTVCWTTGTGKLTVDTTVGCLTSLMVAKNITERLLPEKAIGIIDRLDPFAFRYKDGWGDSGKYEQFGLGAEEVATVDERLVGRDPEGKLQGVRYQELSAVLVGAIKQLKSDNYNLRACHENWKCRIFGIGG